MKKIISILIDIVVFLTAIITAYNVIYLVTPETFNFFWEWLGISQDTVTNMLYSGSAVTTLGIGNKLLKNVVNKDLLKVQAKHLLEIEKVKDLHKIEVALLNQKYENDKLETLESAKELKTQNDLIIKNQKKQLKATVLNYKRQLLLSDDIVSPELKEEYKQFIKDTEV